MAVICVDFDGTCVAHEFPRIGKEIGAVEVLKELVANGNKLILNTMRSSRLHQGTDPLKEALSWFQMNEIPLHGVNKNPTQSRWTDSTKAYGEFYIDDAAIGCPLVYPPNGSNERPYVDWEAMRKLLVINGLIKQ